MIVAPITGQTFAEALQLAVDSGEAHIPAGIHEATNVALRDGVTVTADRGAQVTGDPVFYGSGTLKRARVEGGLWRGRLLKWNGLLSFCTFRGLEVRCHIGWRADGAVGCLWDRVEVTDGDTGVYFDRGEAVNHNTFRDCRWARMRIGVLAQGASAYPLRYLHFDGCWWENLAEVAVRVDTDADVVTVARCWAENMPEYFAPRGVFTVTDTREFSLGVVPA